MQSASISEIIKPRPKDLGGFMVRRLLPAFPRQAVGPFVFLDHMGPHRFAPGTGMDVRPHPHIGLATVTYLYEGAIRHRDSLGSLQDIRPGDVNWMTAGSGIVHSERTPEREREGGGALHGLQMWIALPAAAEESPPSFQHHPAESLPTGEQGGVRFRVVAGHAFGQQSPVVCFSDTLYCALDFSPGGELLLPDEHEERALYLVDGELSIDGITLAPEHLAVLTPGAMPKVHSAGGARAMWLGGAKLDGHRYLWWNFVSSSKERIEQAKADWRAQRFAPVPGETEFIPLPE